LETTQAFGPDYERDAQEYVEFCKNCGLLLSDGIRMWRDTLNAMGISNGTIEVKIASATKLIRGMEHPKPNTPSLQDAMG